MTKRYLVLNGINYPNAEGVEQRAEPGEKIADLPEHVAARLFAEGAISTVPTRKRAAVAAEEE